MRTPKEWFDTTVQPAFKDYRSDPMSEHKADAALYAIAHFDEKVFSYLKHVDPSQLLGAKKLRDFRKALHNKRPELAILREAANARKHGELTETPPERRLVQFATDAVVPGIEGGHVAGKVNRPLGELLQLAVEFWADWIKNNPAE